MTTRQELARAARTMRAALARRDLLIRRMRSEGATLSQIAGAAGMTRQGVQLVCQRDRGEVSA